METQLNYLAIGVSALSTFMIGGLWYSPAVFGKAWMRENGFKEEDMKGSNMLKIFGLSILAAVVAAINLAMFLGNEVTIATGAFYGFLTGFGWVAMFIAMHYLFERRSFTLFLINAGYCIVSLTLMGVIIGAWR